MEETPGPPAQGAPQLLAEAVRYAAHHRWDVVPGSWLTDGAGGPRCSCGDRRCGLPGAHPLGPTWQDGAGAGPETVRRWWTEHPQASVVLPTGRAFDVLDVPESAGCLALARLERMDVRLGPVASAPASGRPGRRLLFLVRPGVRARLPELLRAAGWAPGRLDLAAHGEGGWIVAPPSRVGPCDRVRWARPPSAGDRRLPDGAELLATLAYACGRQLPGQSGARPERSAAAR